jgi:hypothetical protein
VTSTESEFAKPNSIELTAHLGHSEFFVKLHIAAHCCTPSMWIRRNRSRFSS